MMRLLISFLFVAAATQASPMLRSTLPEDGGRPSIYDCLQAAVNGDDCRAAFDGQCVWCKEPVAGLCVTPSMADKIGMLPFFTCDPHNSTNLSLNDEPEKFGAW